MKSLLSAKSWIELSAYGSNAVVRSSYFWAALVPIVAKLFGKISQDYVLEIGSQKLPLVLGVPFTWELLYYGSVCFAAATLIYSIFCPEIIKKYRRYSEFEADGMGSDQLIETATGTSADRATLVSPHSLSKDHFADFCRRYCNRPLDDSYENGSDESIALWSLRVQLLVKNQVAAFAYIRKCFDRHNPSWRLVVSILYRLGMGFFGWVFLMSFLDCLQTALCHPLDYRLCVYFKTVSVGSCFD